MSEQEKKIKDEDLEKVTGGKAKWEGPVVRFTSEEGDWHAGDKFMRISPMWRQWEYLVLQDNGTYTGDYYGHEYNANIYTLSGDEHGDTTITDYAIMMGENSIEFVGQ